MPMATNMPPAGEAAAAAAAAAPPASASWYCTRPTPTESSTSASHCLAERDWPRYATKKSAVKSVAKVVGGLPVKKKVSTKKKGSGKKPAPAAVGNVFLLLGVPALSLLAVAYVGLPIFFP